MASCTCPTFRHKGEIQQRTKTRDAVGGIVEAWTRVSDAVFDIEQLSGEELERATQRFPRSTHRLETRYQSGITTEMRLQFDNDGITHTLHFEDVDNVGFRNQKLMILAKEER